MTTISITEKRVEVEWTHPASNSPRKWEAVIRGGLLFEISPLIEGSGSVYFTLTPNILKEYSAFLSEVASNMGSDHD